MRPSPVLVILLLAWPMGARAADVSPPSITHVRVAEAPKAAPFVIRANIEDESPIFAPAVYVRASGADDYVAIAMRDVGGGRFEAIVPAERMAGILEYFVEAFDELGNGPSRAGTPDAPFRVSTFDPSSRPLPTPTEPPGGWVTADGPTPEVRAPSPTQPAPPPPGASAEGEGGVTSKWWFWTAIGVVVAGAGVAGAVALSQPGPRDFVTVEVAAPDPAAGL